MRTQKLRGRETQKKEKRNRKIMETSYLNIFLVEANLLEIKKAKRILEIYDREWDIKKDKIILLSY